MAKKDIDNNDSNVSISQSELDKAFNNKKAASDAPADKKIAKKPSSTKEILPADQALPVKLLLIPLQGRPIFPGIFTPLMISSSDDTKVIEEVCSGDGYIGIVMLKNETENPSVSDLYEVGTIARIIKKINLPDGGLNVFISTLKRFRIRKALHATTPMAAAVDYLDDEEDDTFEVKALTRALLSEMKEVSENNPLFSEEMRLNMVNIDHPGKIADFIASILNIDKADQQKVLETVNVRRRMEQVLIYIKKEQELLRVQKKIQNELNERVEKNQREYFLREELKSIQEELGTDAEGNATDYQKFKKKAEEFHFEGEIKETVDNELEKFNLMDPNSAEYIGTRNFLELVTQLPWNDKPAENYSLDEAKKILERDHFGLDDVKKRIMEFLSVRKLKQDAKGSILLLVGPPGVGKTSIGHSVADAMHKPFYRFSVGGLRDEAEIKGHRRTYIGALPGKIIQGLRTTKTRAPVFMIDEIDKMGQSYQGDPASALLEVLDPEQNVGFRDNYLDLPFDISDIFFILTANTLDSIPEPLLDRAEVIQLPGYIDQEKIEIAKRYLIPKNLNKNGLEKNQVQYTKDALLMIAEEYAREAGVRNYEKSVDKIHRKIVTELMEEAEKKAEAAAAKKKKEKEAELAVKKAQGERILTQAEIDKLVKANRDLTQAEIDSLVESRWKLSQDDIDLLVKKNKNLTQAEIDKLVAAKRESEKVSAADFVDRTKKYTIDVKALDKYLGKPVFDESEIKKADVAGTAIGLAWTSMGGDTLLIESIAYPSAKGGLQLTGQMGDVMKESAQIAINWVKAQVLSKKLKSEEWFEKNIIHLHIPEGAVKKDGPSAGITMATAFMSLLTGKIIKGHLAMTGELSLTGQVLPIGGLREKTVAARRNGIKTILIPKANVRDLSDIPDHVKAGITFIPVTRAEEVMQHAFSGNGRAASLSETKSVKKIAVKKSAAKESTQVRRAAKSGTVKAAEKKSPAKQSAKNADGGKSSAAKKKTARREKSVAKKSGVKSSASKKGAAKAKTPAVKKSAGKSRKGK
nr:endopeptidase La [Treponema socranskii]